MYCIRGEASRGDCSAWAAPWGVDPQPGTFTASVKSSSANDLRVPRLGAAYPTCLPK